jgi:hypothetical protein
MVENLAACLFLSVSQTTIEKIRFPLSFENGSWEENDGERWQAKRFAVFIIPLFIPYSD